MSERPLHAMRVGYGDVPLLESQLLPSPLAQFQAWLADAVAAELPEPNAMVLATSDHDVPSARTELLKSADARGFTFYTNRESRKGRELRSSWAAALVFPWFAMQRQVSVAGTVTEVSRDESAEYFASRPRGSQVGAWASHQSSVIAGREPLEDAYAAAEMRWPDPQPIPLPDHWGGFVVAPVSVEFWHGRPSRLHDRLRFVRVDESSTAALDDPAAWRIERLSP